MYNIIVNPVNNQYYNLYSKMGKTILKNYIQSLSAGALPQLKKPPKQRGRVQSLIEKFPYRMDQCKNDFDIIYNEAWVHDDYRNTVFLKFTMKDGSREIWCVTEKFYPAVSEYDKDETISRDNYVDNLLYANWVDKKDGTPYQNDGRMGIGGEPGDDRYVRITSVFNGSNRYVLFDEVFVASIFI